MLLPLAFKTEGPILPSLSHFLSYDSSHQPTSLFFSFSNTLNIESFTVQGLCTCLLLLKTFHFRLLLHNYTSEKLAFSDPILILTCISSRAVRLIAPAVDILIN